MPSTPYKLSDSVTLFHGDSREVLRLLPDNCIDSCPCDPPYALVSIVKRFGGANAAPAKGNDAYMRASSGFMGKTWDTGETAMSVEFWREVFRVLKPGGHVAAFGSTRGYHRMACAIEDAGFEIRDSLMWVYGTGFPKSHDVSKGIDKAAGAEREVIGTDKNFGKSRLEDGKNAFGDYAGAWDITAPATDAAREWEGWGTALKPAFEAIVLARKPLSEGTVAANVLRWRTGALNIGACRISGEGNKTFTRDAGDRDREQYRTGTTVGAAIPTDQGRWPANVVHDGSDEVVGAFPNTNGSGKARTLKRGGIGYGSTAEGDEAALRDAGSGSAARFFYSAKASRADRNGSKHPTVKPIALMAWLARLITPPGGTVLDPFAGSGTTGQAAALEGFRALLVEREAEYVADIRARFGEKVERECTDARTPDIRGVRGRGHDAEFA